MGPTKSKSGTSSTSALRVSRSVVLLDVCQSLAGAPSHATRAPGASAVVAVVVVVVAVRAVVNGGRGGSVVKVLVVVTVVSKSDGGSGATEGTST
mmetsp:Transcript_64085/g.193472  ORF Transcript_64085/g.193472 Transcript_64085/m.193472 type:complete len:95 (+) Transcript_64085:200-484(+)